MNPILLPCSFNRLVFLSASLGLKKILLLIEPLSFNSFNVEMFPNIPIVEYTNVFYFNDELFLMGNDKT